jgi:ppGpp synthetase/RelA/SpoT-type nucleotidyltranferase
MSVAKEIRKENESWKDAMARAKKTMQDEKDGATKKIKSETEKLLDFIKRRKELEGLSGTTISKDSKVKAKPKGQRVVTNEGNTTNQYGTFSNKLGRKYYESRDNRSDRLSPDFKDKVYLADGGQTDDIIDAIFNPNQKRGKIETQFGDKTREGLKAMIQNESYEPMEIARAIYFPNSNAKTEKIETSFGLKSIVGLRSMIEDSRASYSDGGSFAKGGLVVTSIKDIPNFEENLEDGKITYRGLGMGKLSDDFYDLAGENGTRIKVEGKEYFITDTEFNSFSRGADGKMRIRFDAPQRKGYADGGSIIGIAETPLARGLGIDYTGLVGETGAMSSGELFADGGFTPDVSDGTQFMDGGALKVEDNNYGGKNLLGYEPYFEEDVTVASFSEKDKIVRPSQGYFYPNPMAKRVISWAKKNGYEFVQDGKKYEVGGSLVDGYLTDPNFGDFQNTMFELGGATGLPEGTQQHFINYYLGQGASQGIFKKGGRLLTQRERYIAELKGLTGLRQSAIDNFIDENNLTNDEILNIVIGLGRKQIKASDVSTAIVGTKDNDEFKKLMTFVKSDKALREYKEGGRVVNIVNEDKEYNEEKYQGIFGDYDGDGVTNINDLNPLDKNKIGKVDDIEIDQTFKKLIDLKNDLDVKMYEALEELDKKAPKNAEFYARTKTPFSIVKKLVDKRLLDPKKGLTDLIGTTVVVSDQKELEKVKKDLDNGLMGEVLDFDDFYENPNNGYRAYHYIVLFKGTPIEVQLKTKMQKQLNEVSHEFYKKGTLNAKGLNEVSEMIMKADKGDKKALEEVKMLLANESELAKKISIESYAMGGELKGKFLAEIKVPYNYESVVKNEFEFIEFLSKTLTKRWFGNGVWGVQIVKPLFEKDYSQKIVVEIEIPTGVTQGGNLDKFEVVEFMSKTLTKKWFGNGIWGVDIVNSYAMGGGLDNHGLKEGDQIIKTMSGGVQKVKTKSGDIVYVDLANGYRGSEPPLPFDNGGEINTKNIAKAKRTKVKKWYLKTYPTDDLGEEIREDITFWSLWAMMSQGYNVYDILDVADSVIRERVFEELSEILEIDYDVIYQKWLNSDEYAKGGRLKSALMRDRKYKNYSEDHEVRYSKDKPQRKGYGFEDGGMMGDDVQMPKLNLGKHKND